MCTWGRSRFFEVGSCNVVVFLVFVFLLGTTYRVLQVLHGLVSFADALLQVDGFCFLNFLTWKSELIGHSGRHCDRDRDAGFCGIAL